MAPRERQIDRGWAGSLLGLQLKVPGDWWGGEGCSNDRNTYTGALKRFDQPSQKWVSSVVGGTGEYGMAYSATLEYVDVNQLDFDEYSRHLVGSPALGGGDGQIASDLSGKQFGKTKGDDWFKWGGPNGRTIKPTPWGRRGPGDGRNINRHGPRLGDNFLDIFGP